MAQAQASPLFRLLNHYFHTFHAHVTPALRSPFPFRQQAHSSPIRHFTTTPSMLAAGRGKDKKNQRDPRITLIRYHLQHPKTPRPLRFSRMRSLRHWTIHRAWMLFRRKKRAAEQLDLQRMYQSMHAACEELWNIEGLGKLNGSRLYRIAMEKKGIYRQGGIPIEYGRAQTDTPGIEAWNHGWTR